jgi:hypothetical protein
VLDDLCSYVFAHRVVEAASGKNYFGMVANFLCFLGKIERIYTDAVPAY